MLPEEQFITSALQFLTEIGADTSEVEPDTNLLDSGVLDSLGTLAFLDFLEQQRDEEIDIEKLHLESIATLRNAYRFVLGEE
jgi:acyl carrier protein